MDNNDKIRNEKVGTGDVRFDDEHLGGTKLPGTPGYESEAAFRHRNHDEYQQPELMSTQLAPGLLDEDPDATEHQVEISGIGIKGKTPHHKA